MALFSTLKGAARPITTQITTYHHIRHASRNIPQESSKFFIDLEWRIYA